VIVRALSLCQFVFVYAYNAEEMLCEVKRARDMTPQIAPLLLDLPN